MTVEQVEKLRNDTNAAIAAGQPYIQLERDTYRAALAGCQQDPKNDNDVAQYAEIGLSVIV